MDMVCGWVLWKAREHPRGCSPCQVLIRGAVKRVHFLCRLLSAPPPVGGFDPLAALDRHRARVVSYFVCIILHTRTPQALTNSKKKGGSRQSLERALEPNLPGVPPIISLVAWGRLLKQLNFDCLI